nr:hypothetical protein RTCK_01238 [Rhizobium sp. TCK]
MREVLVSIDVYAAIWAARQPGEENEDQVLRRLLRVRQSEPKVDNSVKGQLPKIGFRDARYEVEMPENFEIFRVYKGTEYRARAIDGEFELLNTRKRYASLNKLSRAVTGNIENAWRNWYFTGKDGNRYLIEGLRMDATRKVRHLM